MKKGLLLASLCIGFILFAKGQTTDPVLMTVGDEKVTLSEFAYIFKKNNTSKVIDKAALDEYLDLFIKFKLKVKEAKDLKMDTVSNFKNELNGYVDQLASPFLKDKEAEDKLVKESYDRALYDLKIRHILVKVGECAAPKDTLEAYNKIMKIRTDLIKSKNFDDAAKKFSQDTISGARGGEIGFITTSPNTNYLFESAAYKLKPGEVSMPVRSKQGYHLIKLDEIRPARGTVKVAHIFIRADKKDQNAFKVAENRINEAYTKLQQGQDWNTVVKTYSDDYKTASTGGELQVFGINQMVQEFEDAAFGLKTAGDYTKPFSTEYGLHIIKLVEKTKVPAFDDEKSELAKSLSKTKRFDIVKQAYVNKLKKEYNFTENKAFMNQVEAVAALNGNKLDKSSLSKLTGMTLFTYTGGEVKSDDLIAQATGKLTADKTIDFCAFQKKTYEEYVGTVLTNYKKTQLPKENQDFKMLVNEYTEGILLFNLMDQNVWTRSVKDTTGLKTYHDQNKNNYMWGERAQVYIVDVKNDTIEKQARKLAPKLLAGKITKEKFLGTLNKKVKDNVFIIDGLFSKGDNAMVDNAGFTTGITPTVKKDGKTRFVIVYQIRSAEPKTLKEAKGMVISDYQNYLEEEWLKSLRAKYPVNVNKDVLYQLISK